MTEAGALLGTPHYMAPEQWNGLASDARTDVYAMGATLFQMLAGRPPFAGETRDELLTQHCQAPVPPLGRFNPAVSEGTMTVVARAMAKKPEDRYPDAAAMLRDLEALRHGTPTAGRDPSPAPPGQPRRGHRVRLGLGSRGLAPPALAARLQHRAGEPCPRAPRPSLHDARAPQGGVERYAEFRKVVPFAWREHPFEWIEGQRFGVLREFQKGLFHWFLSLVELEPRPGGGTRLTQHIRVLPRGTGGRLMAHFQLGRGGRRALEKVYRRIDAAVTGKLGSARGRSIRSRSPRS